VTDASTPDPAAVPAPGQAQEIDIDIAAFLPEGVELAVETAEVVEVVEEPAPPAVDLEALTQIERDLDAVDAAIAALDAGTYGVDPATGQPIDDALLADNPTRLS
jgi:hypothetical protein